MKIKIKNKFYEYFNNLNLNFSLDSVASSFSFVGRFNPDNPNHREIFKPLAYNKVEILSNDDELLFTGVIVSTVLNSSNTNDLQQLSGYSLPGILEDCTLSYSDYPLENLNVTLNDLVKKIVNRFDFDFIVDETVNQEMNLLYNKTVAQPTETLKSFISRLASQRNIILGHTTQGNLLFFRIDTNKKPVLFLNSENTLSMTLSVNGQNTHNEITVIRQPSKDNTSLTPADTVQNNLVLNTSRSIVKILTSGNEASTQKAADNVLGEQLKNVTLSVALNRVENVRCGDIIEVQNKEVYLYERTRFVISSIQIQETNENTNMNLTLVLPESFTGTQPKNIFA